MARRLPPIDRSRVRTVSARRRPSKVHRAAEARPWSPGGSLQRFLDGLPAILAAADLRAAIEATARARARKRTLLWGFGAHLIKVGLAPVMVDLMERGFVSALMMNGAGCVHDLELAMMGRTSEDVGPALDDGSFGMARETTERLNAAIAAGHRDFETLAGLVARLEGGVYWNVGSAVILPEVFLKALALARNLGFRVRRVTTVNLDFQRQYRPTVNVVERPTRLGGRGISLLGPHEILLPLVAAALVERDRAGRRRSRR